MPSSELPADVRAVCQDWLAELDRTSPGLVTGLYLRGGIGFGEYVVGKSDIDFTATLSRRPDDADLRQIEAAHDGVRERYPALPFDGSHLLADDLASDPEQCPDVPTTLHGLFTEEARHDINPVSWHELAHHGKTVAGKPLAELDIWTDDDVLRTFTIGNLDTYWREHAEALPNFPAEAAKEQTCEWCVLGVARLDHLLVTGEQTTKSGAGRWGLTHYDERWHRVIREALRLREGGPEEYDDPADRGADVTAFTAYAVERGTSS